MSKKLIYLLLYLPFILILLSYLNLYHYRDYQTSLHSGVFILDNTSELTANRWSVPQVVDWNSDGKKDLLVGNRTYDSNSPVKGYISYFQNTGTDSSPAFNGFSYIKTCSGICSDLTVEPDG